MAERYFGFLLAGLTVTTIIGAPLATYVGQTFGWREAYATVAAIAAIALISLYFSVPRKDALNGRPISTKLAALRSGAAWGLMLVAATGVSSIFAVYTLIGPLITDVAGLGAGIVPVALAVFGIGIPWGTSWGAIWQTATRPGESPLAMAVP